MASDVITLEEVKEFLQIDHDCEDSLIKDLIDAAIVHIEDYTGRAIVEREGEFTRDSCPLIPYKVTEDDEGNKRWETSTTSKLPALRPAIYLMVRSLYESDPKTIALSQDAAERLARLQRVNWGF